VWCLRSAATMNVTELPPFSNYTLTEFVERGSELVSRVGGDDDVEAIAGNDADTEEAHADLVHFMLSGRDRQRNTTAKISVLSDAVSEEQAAEFRVAYDFDSMLGTTLDLPYATAISVYPVAEPKRHINKTLHIKHTLPPNEAGRVSGPPCFLFPRLLAKAITQRASASRSTTKTFPI
jgi:hypothetical protein